ncbi:MAG: hypothetical protein AzoDbin1_04712 [Azoarcus sp.]|nr:hypothetical protein [Azoarcus sp.]
MAKNIRTLVAAAAVPLVFAVGNVHADYTGTCGDRFTTLDMAIVGATFTNDMDRTNLRGKVSGAVTKVAYEKIADAITLLDAVSDKAYALATAAKPKLDGPGAKAIMDGSYATIMCLNPNYIP